jgi:hypothetical protein
MFKALFKVQWKSTRGFILAAIVLGFAIPLFSVRDLVSYAAEYGRLTADGIVRGMQAAGVLYAVLAGGVGLAVAFFAWAADQKGRHLYALSLPVTRARYALMRFGAGALMLLVPAAGVLLGCLVALLMIQLPAGMQAYPLALTMRFLLASFVSYALFFAIAGSSQRSAAVLLGLLGGFVVFSVMLGAMNVQTDLLSVAGRFLFAEPGLLSVFTGRWMLLDV